MDGPLLFEQGKALTEGLDVFGCEEITKPSTNHRLFGVTKDLAPGLIDIEKTTRFIERLVAQRRFVKKLLKTLFAVLQFFFAALQLFLATLQLLFHLLQLLLERQDIRGYRSVGFHGLGDTAVLLQIYKIN